MSLNVYLISPIKAEIECSECGKPRTIDIQLYQDDVTHNLNNMAIKAGIYKHLWYPDELDITKASQLIVPLTDALLHLKTKPKYFEQFNSSNGCGNYDTFLKFVENYLEACLENPDAIVEVSR